MTTIGSRIKIPDAPAAKDQFGKERVQPGLPGLWSIWSKSDHSPGAVFVLPADEPARALGVKFAIVRITQPRDETARVQLLDTEPSTAMPALKETS